jgi:hypothetical protein
VTEPVGLVHTERVRALSLSFPCADCEARVGLPCVGSRSEGFVHYSRLAPVWVIYKIGFAAGIAEGKRRRDNA